MADQSLFWELAERYGCPAGTLTAELAKLGHPCRPEATTVFTLCAAAMTGSSTLPRTSSQP